MSVPDAAILEKVLQWLAYSDEDLRLAVHGFTLTPHPPHRLIAYHAQQCVEKHLKAYLVFLRVDFPYTHNIARLLDLCASHAEWGEALRIAEELTPFAITARYLGEDEEVTEEEARRAVDIARHHCLPSPAKAERRDGCWPTDLGPFQGPWRAGSRRELMLPHRTRRRA